jgi:ectoine hydroxylase-related dioxygenase (phytanoyl-CoA dioxygenase family)
MNPNFEQELNSAYPLTEEQVMQYDHDGFIKLRQVFSPALLTYFGNEIRRYVEDRSRDAAPLTERNTYGKAFLQLTNLWEENETIAHFSLARRLGHIAAQLMCVPATRMYHDQALFKEPGGGFTPWHADQFYWPLSSNQSLTAWIPLQDTPLEMGPLQFCIGSQRMLANRDLEISDESEEKIGRSLSDYSKDETPYDFGEVSFHSGWTFHRAGPNQTNDMRAVMTVIIIADGVRHQQHRASQEGEAARFLPGIAEGEVIASPLNPIMYSEN